MLSPGVPPEQKNRAEREVKVAQEEFERLQPSITTATQNFERFQRDAQEKQAMFNDRKQGVKEVKEHMEKLARSKRKFAEAQKDAAKDNKTEKKRCIKEIRNLIQKFTTEIKNATTAYNQFLDATARQTGVRMSEDGLISKKQSLNEELENIKQQTESLQREFERVRYTFDVARAEVMALKERADAFAPIGTVDDPTPLKLKIEEITGDREELELLITEAKERIQRIVNNPAVIRNYQELKEKLDTQKEDFEDLKNSKGIKRTELKNLKDPYLAALTNIVEKVTGLFGSYMGNLGCAGKFFSTFCFLADSLLINNPTTFLTIM